MKKQKTGVIAGIVALLVAGGWYLNQGDNAKAGQEGGKGPGKGPGMGQMAPATVNVVKPQQRDVGVELMATGTVTPMRTVDLRAQTVATIRQVHVKEGDFVKEGQLLFSLDDRADRANVARAVAQVAKDRATLADLERQYQRSKELVEQKFLAQSALDSLQSQVEAQRAVVKSNEAAARASEVTASYTAIRAPMSGRIGAIDTHPGALVQMTTSLTKITQLDPIHVSFTLPETALAPLLAAQQRGKVEVRATTSAGGAPVTGTLSFIDNAVDAQAGTILVKGEFANRDMQLWPGQYATARVTVDTLKDALVIPQNAIITSMEGTFVYAVQPDQSVRKVPVKRLYAFGDEAAVSGLTGNEQVVTDGKQNVRPDGKVRIAQPKSGTAAGAPAAKGKGDAA